MPSLFISYRRSDSPDTVKLIYERLKKRLPRREVFYDHESIRSKRSILGLNQARPRWRDRLCPNSPFTPCMLRRRGHANLG